MVYEGGCTILTNNVPVMRANSVRGSLEGVRPENQEFLGTKMATSEVSAQKSLDFQGPPPSNGPCNGSAPIKRGGV